MNMAYTKDELFKMFQEEVLGKEQIHIAGFAFNTTYNYDNVKKNKTFVIKEHLPNLQIKNEEELKDLLFQYHQLYMSSNRKFTQTQNMDEVFGTEKNKTLFALTNLFINAGFEDFENMNTYIKRSIDFLKSDIGFAHNFWHDLGEMEGVKNARVSYRIAQNNYSLETPDRLEVKVERINSFGEEETLYLPIVSFGISQNTAYVYTLQNLYSKTNESPQLQKELNRARFKLNANVPQEEQDVEPLNIITATVLAGFLKTQQVNKIYVNNFLPIRYFAKSEAYARKAGHDEEKLHELQEQQQHIQENLTTKFLRTFLRVEQQTGAITLFSDINPGHTIFQNTPSTPEIPNPFLIQLHENAQHSINLTQER